MQINELMESKNMTKYRLSKNSGIPYTTVNDICSGRAALEKCSAETVYRISRELGVTMESLIAPCFDKQPDFELFKSNVCHRLKKLGDIDFIIELLEKDDIHKYYNKKCYPEALYLLAMLDYISRENGIALCTAYDDIRKLKLKDTVYPASILATAKVSKNDKIKQTAYNNAIPEFIRFNIVENEVRNVF